MSPTRKEVYIDTRTRKDGSIVNEHAARFIVRLSFVHTFFDSITYTETIC